MPSQERPEFFLPWHEELSKFDSYVKAHNTSAKALCLSFILQQDAIDRIVIGLETVEQLSELTSYVQPKAIQPFDTVACSDPKLLDPFRWRV
jgi:aryl-alcohol dehydrogenase-like predicted oxidoreductase